MKARSTIFSVYGPVLLAALLIIAAAPACAMPNCGIDVTGGASTSSASQSQFKSACDIGAGHTPANSPVPCHDGSCDDTLMSHGNPEGTPVAGVDLPVAAVIAQAPRAVDIVVIAVDPALTPAPAAHPPDPLGVRLSV